MSYCLLYGPSSSTNCSITNRSATNYSVLFYCAKYLLLLLFLLPLLLLLLLLLLPLLPLLLLLLFLAYCCFGYYTLLEGRGFWRSFGDMLSFFYSAFAIPLFGYSFIV